MATPRTNITLTVDLPLGNAIAEVADQLQISVAELLRRGIAQVACASPQVDPVLANELAELVQQVRRRALVPAQRITTTSAA
jgi:hypothetical protein